MHNITKEMFAGEGENAIVTEGTRVVSNKTLRIRWRVKGVDFCMNVPPHTVLTIEETS